MKQKVVIKVTMNGQKSRPKALKIVVGAFDVESVAWKGDNIEVTGEVFDPAVLTLLLRKKLGYADLLSVEEKKEDVAKLQKFVFGCDGGGGSSGGGGDGGSSGSDGGSDIDGGDITGGGGGGKMGTEEEPEDQHDNHRNSYSYHAGDENGYPVGQLHRCNYQAAMATAIMMVGIKLNAVAIEKWIPKRGGGQLEMRMGIQLR